MAALNLVTNTDWLERGSHFTIVLLYVAHCVAQVAHGRREMEKGLINSRRGTDDDAVYAGYLRWTQLVCVCVCMHECPLANRQCCSEAPVPSQVTLDHTCMAAYKCGIELPHVVSVHACCISNCTFSLHGVSNCWQAIRQGVFRVRWLQAYALLANTTANHM